MCQAGLLGQSQVPRFDRQTDRKTNNKDSIIIYYSTGQVSKYICRYCTVPTYLPNYLPTLTGHTGQDMTGQDRTGQDRTGQDVACIYTYIHAKQVLGEKGLHMYVLTVCTYCTTATCVQITTVGIWLCLAALMNDYISSCYGHTYMYVSGNAASVE